MSDAATTEAATILRAARVALARNPRIGLALHPIRVQFVEGDLVMEGEVANIAAKKLALEAAAAVRGVSAIVDRLRVAPAQRMEDGQIRALVADALLQEPGLAEATIRCRVTGGIETAREPDQAHGIIDIRVDDGVVTLDGDLPGLDRKRIAGVLAWWVPGSRDVVNGIGVTPPEDDSDDDIAEAVRLVLEKDPFVNASQIRVGVRHSVVTLAGLVPTETERDMAELDAWYVFGVDKVEDRIEVGR